MSTISTNDKRINVRSPYYIDSREAPTPVTPPDPIEENTPPTVTITVSNQYPTLGETVTLTAVATDSDGTIVSYEWGGFGVGQTTESITATNTTLIESQVFSVTVTDNDGDTASALATVHWQEAVSKPIETFTVDCGDIVNEASFVNEKKYILNVGDKIGTVEIEFLNTNGTRDVPVKFDLEWDGNTATSGYIGADWYDDVLADEGIAAGDINTGEPSTKDSPTTLTINKTAASPEEVNLTASAFIPNDNYSFRLNCPDVEETITKFYTITGTTEGGNTDFSYTDVNGDEQTVTLSEGETEKVSAQEGTVSITSGTGTTEEGSQSFDLGVPEQELTSTTELIILFDSSGSMSATEEPLKEMANGNLKNTLLSYYNNDVVEYNKRVKFFATKDFCTEIGIGQPFQEDFMKLVKALPRNSDTTKQIFLLFQDEVLGKNGNSYQNIDPVYGSEYESATSNYNTDLASYRTFLNTKSYGEYFLTFFNVDYFDLTDDFIDNIFSGNFGFSGSKGLSDRSEITIVSNVQDGVSYSNNPNYYHDLIIAALRGYGFNI